MTTSQKQFKNLLAWEAFLHTARTGNITLTAQVLNIDGSAVSRLIKGLEEELEQPLFDRSSRPFSLTPRGKRLREEVEPLVTGFEALISRRFEEPKQIIRVSAPADLSRYIIPEQLMNYTIEHPNVQFELSSLGSASEVLAGTVDAALTQHRPSNNANLTLRPCITASSPVLATPEYIDRYFNSLQRRRTFRITALEECLYCQRSVQSEACFASRLRHYDRFVSSICRR